MSCPKKYILYCAQDANFQTRSMLIPYDDIMECENRVKDLEILRFHAVKNATFKHRGNTYVVDQLLIENLVPSSFGLTAEITPYTSITNNFTRCAMRMCEPIPEKWFKGIITEVASKGFNNVTNYCNFRNRTTYKNKPIEIVEGFLVLQFQDGEFDMPNVDTEQEMFDVYYSGRNDTQE
jgi:hypothetical protein